MSPTSTGEAFPGRTWVAVDGNTRINLKTRRFIESVVRIWRVVCVEINCNLRKPPHPPRLTEVMHRTTLHPSPMALQAQS